MCAVFTQFKKTKNRFWHHIKHAAGPLDSELRLFTHSPAASIILWLSANNLSQQWTLLLSLAQWVYSQHSENKQRAPTWLRKSQIQYQPGWVGKANVSRVSLVEEWKCNKKTRLCVTLNLVPSLPLQLSPMQSSVNTSARSTCSSTLCWTSRKQPRPTDAAATTCLTAACVSVAVKAAATRWATTSARSARHATFRCTPRHEPPCLSEVSGLHQ